MLPIILSHTPAGASTRQLLHYGQGVSSKKFRKYDFGNENIVKYNSEEPPEYNIKKMTARIATFYGPNDILAAEQVWPLKVSAVICRYFIIFSFHNFTFSSTWIPILGCFYLPWHSWFTIIFISIY